MNPFASAPPAKPRAAGLTKRDADMIARLIAKHTHDATAPLLKRIAALEQQITVEQGRVNDAIKAVSDQFLGDDSGPDQPQLDRMYAQHEKRMAR